MTYTYFVIAVPLIILMTLSFFAGKSIRNEIEYNNYLELYAKYLAVIIVLNNVKVGIVDKAILEQIEEVVVFNDKRVIDEINS